MVRGLGSASLSVVRGFCGTLLGMVRRLRDTSLSVVGGLCGALLSMMRGFGSAGLSGVMGGLCRLYVSLPWELGGDWERGEPGGKWELGREDARLGDGGDGQVALLDLGLVSHELESQHRKGEITGAAQAAAARRTIRLERISMTCGMLPECLIMTFCAARSSAPPKRYGESLLHRTFAPPTHLDNESLWRAPPVLSNGAIKKAKWTSRGAVAFMHEEKRLALKQKSRSKFSTCIQV
nr:hypothetical protein CFP56_31689 [Quercus suber]